MDQYPIHTRFFTDSFGSENSISIQRIAHVGSKAENAEGETHPGFRVTFTNEDTLSKFHVVVDNAGYNVLRRALQSYPI